jgi:hypothetical protein
MELNGRARGGRRPRRLARAAALVVVAAVSSACGSRHVRLVSPDTTAGSRYTCEPGDGKVCTPATTDVPSDLNERNTAFVILPRECKGRIQQIVVINADSSEPKVDATCAPEEAPVEEMGSEPAEPEAAAREDE